MDQTRLDAVIAAVTAGIVALGAIAAWQQYRQMRIHGEMMGHTATHGLQPAWYLLGSLLVAGAVAGIYWAVRDSTGTDASQRVDTRAHDTDPTMTDSTLASIESPSSPDSGTEPRTESQSEPKTDTEPAADPTSDSTPRVLEVLPADERRILEPVLESPGITQIALRDRADFSKSKVSQTVTDLEKRGLLYRERQGRTYRVYPSDDLEER
ncbi:helix-turn-helix transcriptional regulator [Natronorubrum halalkaliphilum]|uniref:helix-turn-helix transcriptional regulator n=1 Tax=Natronorubrum halalkaliphilum TaxID=2691917 RepID=UPI002E2D6283|nr:MarR family transcriptional regulator [Natronorubrum halalkaliphilum]